MPFLFSVMPLPSPYSTPTPAIKTILNSPMKLKLTAQDCCLQPGSLTLSLNIDFFFSKSKACKPDFHVLKRFLENFQISYLHKKKRIWRINYIIIIE